MTATMGTDSSPLSLGWLGSWLPRSEGWALLDIDRIMAASARRLNGRLPRDADSAGVIRDHRDARSAASIRDTMRARSAATSTSGSRRQRATSAAS
jgi:hypothetical protein